MWRRARLLTSALFACWLLAGLSLSAIVPATMRLEQFTLFNATTSDIAFGVATSQDLQAQTTLAYVNLIGAGENNQDILWAKTGSADDNGPRMDILHNAGTPQFGWGASSSGAFGSPFSNEAGGNFVYGKPAHLAATWDGGLTASSGITLYVGMSNAPLVLTANSFNANGSGNTNFGVGNNFHVGNREATDRTTNGTIYYVARWNHILTLNELRTAQAQGPLSVSAGLVFMWANGRDYSLSHLTPTSQTAIVLGGTPASRAELGPSPLRVLFDVPGAAAGGGATVKRLLLLGAGD